jgi:hypothetical protein
VAVTPEHRHELGSDESAGTNNDDPHERSTAIERHDPAVELNRGIRMRDHEEMTVVL